jgi:hypothetical protein
MSKWIAEFELEDGDTMPEHMDLEYMGAKIDFHCKPFEQEPVLDKIRAEIENLPIAFMRAGEIQKGALKIIDKYRAESEET